MENTIPQGTSSTTQQLTRTYRSVKLVAGNLKRDLKETTSLELEKCESDGWFAVLSCLRFSGQLRSLTLQSCKINSAHL